MKLPCRETHVQANTSNRAYFLFRQRGENPPDRLDSICLLSRLQHRCTGEKANFYILIAVCCQSNIDAGVDWFSQEDL